MPGFETFNGCDFLMAEVDLIHEMRRTGKQRGLATLCIGGGQGAAAAKRGPGRNEYSAHQHGTPHTAFFKRNFL